MEKQVAAIIAAAGRSRRMGQPKQLLPWGDGTVIEAVVENLAIAGAAPVICIVGHLQDAIRATLARSSAQVVENPGYLAAEMLRSYQEGIRTVQSGDEGYVDGVCGTLLALGDQPHIPVDIIRQVIDEAKAKPDAIIIPSYQMRRGHPIYLPRLLWTALLSLGEDDTLRQLLRQYDDQIVYINVKTDLILRDMDTPEEYQAMRDVLGK